MLQLFHPDQFAADLYVAVDCTLIQLVKVATVHIVTHEAYLFTRVLALQLSPKACVPQLFHYSERLRVTPFIS